MPALDLEERVEDAIVAYMQANVPGEVRIYPAWGFTSPQYPCAIVHAGENAGAAGQMAEWHGARELQVDVQILVESADETAGGAVVRTARERNRWVRDAVLKPLATESLLESLRAVEMQGVIFSQAVLMTATRGADESRRMMTTARLYVIAGLAEL